MRFNKKAALKLSIIAIVVFLVVIIILGLGIFIKKQFSCCEITMVDNVNIKEQFNEQMRKGELLVFSVPEQVSVGKLQGVIIGVRNNAGSSTGDSVCFRLEVQCIKPLTAGARCAPDVVGPVAVGGYDFENSVFVPRVHNWFKTIVGEFDLKSFDSTIFDATMLIRGDVKPDSYMMKINVYKAIDNKDCKSRPDFSDKTAALYVSKSFIWTLV